MKQNIKNHFKKTLIIIISVLLLIKLSIFLYNNWYTMPKIIKLLVVVLPLLFSQILSIYVLLNRFSSKIWREVITVFLFITFRLSIFLTFLIYHISWDSSSLYLLYNCICLPFIYIFKSTIGVLIYLFVILNYLFFSDSMDISTTNFIGFCIMFLAILPYYFSSYRLPFISSFITNINELFSKKIVLFICLSLQFLFILGMISRNEYYLHNTREYKFICNADGYYGNVRDFILLRFKENKYKSSEKWKYNDEIFVSIEENDMGYAKISAISKHRPSDKNPYIKARVAFYNYRNSEVHIYYPFNRFYMDGDKKSRYSKIYSDDTKSIHAIISVKGENAVLRNVFVDGESCCSKKMIKD